MHISNATVGLGRSIELQGPHPSTRVSKGNRQLASWEIRCVCELVSGCQWVVDTLTTRESTSRLRAGLRAWVGNQGGWQAELTAS